MKRFLQDCHILFRRLYQQDDNTAYARQQLSRTLFLCFLEQSNVTIPPWLEAYGHQATVPDALRAYTFSLSDDATDVVTPRLFGQAVEQCHTPTDRKRKGAFYTPRPLVESMVRLSLIDYLSATTPNPRAAIEQVWHLAHRPDDARLDDALARLKICDPAIGTGGFALGLLDDIVRVRHRLDASRSRYALKWHTIQHTLHGIDIDPVNLEIVRMRLWLSLLAEQPALETLPDLPPNFVAGNALVITGEVAQLFQTRFDLIIGNPPWVTLRRATLDPALADYYQQHYTTGFKLNLFALFVELGLKQLPPRGILSLLVPSRLLDTPSYHGLRQQFVGTYTILGIDTVPSRLFADIVAEQIILRLEKSPTQQTTIPVGTFQQAQRRHIPLAQVMQHPNLTVNIHCSPRALSIVAAFQQRPHILLGDICDVHVGMMIKHKQRMLRDTPPTPTPIVTGRDLTQHLIRKRRYFEVDKVEIFGGTKRPIKHQESPKLLLRKTGQTLVCAYDNQATFAEQSVYLVLLRAHSFDLRFLSAVLNSKLLTYYFRNELITNPQAYPYLQHYDVRKLPIPRLNQREQAPYIQQVDDILRQPAQMSPALAEIDRLMYGWYGLTPADIQQIEQP